MRAGTRIHETLEAETTEAVTVPVATWADFWAVRHRAQGPVWSLIVSQPEALSCHCSASTLKTAGEILCAGPAAEQRGGAAPAGS